MVAAEASIRGSDTLTANPAAATVSSNFDTPNQQMQLSRNIIPDYTFYSLEFISGSELTSVCALVEVKRKASFNDDAVCQTIGYYIARKQSKQRSTDNGQSSVLNADSFFITTLGTCHFPPLAILFCEDQVQFIFFPFCKDECSGVVTSSVKLFNSLSFGVKSLDWKLFSYIYFYISTIWSEFDSLNPDDWQIPYHPKKSYREIMEPELTLDALKVKSMNCICV